MVRVWNSRIGMVSPDDGFLVSEWMTVHPRFIDHVLSLVLFVSVSKTNTIHSSPEFSSFPYRPTYSPLISPLTHQLSFRLGQKPH